MKKLITIAAMLFLISIICSVFPLDRPVEGTPIGETPTPTPTPAPTEVWVDDNYSSGGGNDGHTWGYDAFATIQAGIDAVSGSTVHVAAGTYRENITLKNGVELLGAGNATTTIDGMKTGTVIVATNLGNTTRVDGFTVTNGSASGNGGGMYNYNASPAIGNCSFINNSASSCGGGIYNQQYSSPVITGCSFTNNSAGSVGGGISNQVYCSPVITKCTFTENSAGIHGGGMFNQNHCSPIITNCVFTSNRAGTNGGGIYSESYSSPAVTDCTFQNNRANNGGGMFNYQYSYSSATVTNCIFRDNTASSCGGGIYNWLHCSPTVTNCSFINNSARNDNGGGMFNFNYCSPIVADCSFINNSATTYYGGGMHNEVSCSPIITNCIFQDNRASDGGGIDNYQQCSPVITNCTFFNNSTTSDGGGINNRDSSPTITNCILWGDSPNEIVDTATVTYSDVQGNLYAGTGNINASPAFVNAAGGDLHLSAGSPCIDAGDNSAAPATDKDGVTRPLDGDGNGTATADMGAYEAPPPVSEVWVDDDYSSCGANDGHTWGYDAFDTIQEGIDAVSGSTVHVAAGTYYENVVLKDGVELLGNGSATTFIDGSSTGSVITATGVGSSTKVDGFTITHGSAANGGGMNNSASSSPTVTNCTFQSNSAEYGGGMYNYQSSPTVTDCTFISNSAPGSGDQGGGMFNQYSNAIITNCTFQSNSACWYGGGIYNNQCSPTITSCTFISNTAGNYFSGGGIANYYYASPTITNCTFQSNYAHYFGGGIYNSYYCSPAITECTFISNSVLAGGGGMYNEKSSAPTVTNCLFISNSGNNYGGGIYNKDGGRPNIINCDFYGNSAGAGNGIANVDSTSNARITNCIVWPDGIYTLYATPTITYCDYPGGTGTNIDLDPVFVNAAGGDLHLTSSSPCIDTGSNSAAPATDKDGITRPLDGDGNGTATADMGAYEAPAPLSVVWVDDNYTSGSCGGHTWNYDAFDTIQEGIDAVSGSTVHVAAGTYYENIVLKDGVELLGAGNASTIIDGMQSGSVVSGTGLGAGTIIDGFTITNGSSQDFGGGLYLVDSSLNISNCSISSNLATDDGGGMRLEDSAVSVTGCTFQDNSASDDAGGIDVVTGSNLNITDCTLFNNSALAGNGGGIRIYTNCSITAVNCTFEDNTAQFNGGAVKSFQADADFTGCAFTNNSALSWGGGGMYNDQSSPVVTNCSFQNNSASGDGGGISNSGASPTITNCTFTGNHAGAYGGGGIYGDATSSPVVVNCIFDSNVADGAPWANGGGVYIAGYSISFVITNCTFFNNSADDGGGISGNENTSVTNCILWQNSPNQISPTNIATVSYCDVEGGYTGTGNINMPPLFVDAANGDFHLMGGSPCIDAGDNSAPSMPGTDKDGVTRPLDGNGDSTATADMGAYEFCGYALTINADPAAGGTPTGAGVYACNSSAAIHANTSAGYTFTGWTPAAGIGNASAADTNVSMTQNRDLTAHYTLTTPKVNSKTNIKSIKISNYGQSVTFIAIVTARPGTPTGTVTFMDGATVIAPNVPVISGKATFTTTTLMPGLHAITAVYSGDVHFNGSTSTVLIQLVRTAKTWTGLTSSINPSVTGQSVTFTATVSTAAAGLGTPTGTVTFKNGKVILGVIALDGSGQAKYSTAALSWGKHSIIATYSGDGNYSSSLGRLSQWVNR